MSHSLVDLFFFFFFLPWASLVLCFLSFKKCYRVFVITASYSIVFFDSHLHRGIKVSQKDTTNKRFPHKSHMNGNKTYEPFQIGI